MRPLADNKRAFIMSHIEIKKSNQHTMFNPAFIDDYGFTPEEFRIFARIMRRALGSDRDCFESIPNLASSLGISEGLVRRALKVLEACGAITRTERKGKSDLFDFNTCDKWASSEKLSRMRAAIEADLKAKDRLRKSQKSPVVMETVRVSGDGNVTTPLTETQPVVVMETTDEGTPSEGYPRREEENTPPRRKLSSDEAAKLLEKPQPDFPTESEAEKIYREFYPTINLSPYQLALINNNKNLAPALWRLTLKAWIGSNNRGKNIEALLDRYDNEARWASERAAKSNGFNNHSAKPQSRFYH